MLEVPDFVAPTAASIAAEMRAVLFAWSASTARGGDQAVATLCPDDSGPAIDVTRTEAVMPTAIAPATAKHEPPGLRRHDVFHDAIRCMEANDSGRSDEGEHDEELQSHGVESREQKLTDAEGRPGGDSANDDGPHDAGA